MAVFVLHLYFSFILLLIFTFAESNQLLKNSQANNFLPKCEPSKFLKCIDRLAQNDKPLPVTVEELNIECNELTEAVKCFDKQNEYCLTSDQRKVFQDFFNGTKFFINDICKHGSTQTDYLRYAKCYQNVSVDDKKCANQYQIAMTTPVFNHIVTSSEKIIQLSCCNLHRFLECQYDYVDKDCGAEARRFIEKHLGQATHPLMSRHCSIFTSNLKANCNMTNDLTEFNTYMFNQASDAYKFKLIWLSVLFFYLHFVIL